MAIEQSSYSMLRGDVTWYKSLKGTGSHEFQTGFLAMPRNYYKGTNVVIDPSGLTAQSVRLLDPNNINSPTVPLDRTFQTGALELVNTEGRDRDLGIYVQDTWRPIQRLTMTLGVRSDFVRRNDLLRSFEIEKSIQLAPRLGGALLLDDNARNVVRASFARVHRQLMGGRDAVAAFSGNPTSSSKTQYDANGDGVFESEVLTPPCRPPWTASGSTRTSISRSWMSSRPAISVSCRST